MMRLVLVAQALQDADRLLLGGLVDHDCLEAALERGVLLEVLAVLVDGGRADHLDLAARQRRLEDRGGVDRAFGRAGADERVHLVDEQDDVFGVDHLFDDLLEALLELATVLAARNERRHVERDQALAAQDVRHLVGDDELGEALGHGGLAHARLADEQRVVLLAAAQDLHHALDLARAADDRIELAVARLLREVGAELLEHAVGLRTALGERVAAGVDRALAHQIVERGADVVALDAEASQHVERRALPFADDAEQQMLGGDVALPHLHGLAQGVLQHALHARGERQMARHVGSLVDGDDLADGRDDVVVLDVEALERLGGKAVLLLYQAEQDVLGAHVGLMQGTRLVLREDEHLARLVGELLE